MAPVVENRGPELLAVNIFFVSAAVLATALRCYVRAGLVKAFGTDDWLMVLALAFFICYSTFSILGVHYGTGRHFADIEDDHITKALECWWFCYLFYSLSMIVSKMSIGFFLLRITTRRLHSWIIYMAMMFTVLAGVVFFFVTLFQCHPISFFWNKSQPGSCIDVNIVIALAYLYSAFSVISDLTFAILPAFLVWNLQLRKKTKFALIPLLIMGCVASSAVLVRFGYLMGLKDADFLWSTLDIAIWSSVEQGLAITAGSLATLRPLLKAIGYKLGMTSNPSPHRVTDDATRRPSAFAATTFAKSSNGPPQSGHEDLYSMSYFPCKCCGTFKCQKRQSEATSGKRRSSMGFSARAGKGDVEALSHIKSVSENGSEEELTYGGRSTREASHDNERVVPKSFLIVDEQKDS
ncbi:hypothetical protein HER10_EVM0008434 [Colletotrichum scovillei]|uniref:Integral membrane protein n=1 Tax=Colletotrichum scovillei TaxID=1209932 RepID=A0A9P7R9B5_9PEZI|nr:uncharacterized protein HER10_EVM0008434 [Colletotrichum scovillei]KAF4783300.1 hypothetical protein HER10_EVM0008434 [Colletotrichum scovillei]KAG7053226.1 integral membrane protein [Colletotrichum scovillei]KAG7071522.1 integral membrane protein [Colletotrichum scovillei]KAG7079773.1 integral membrane protein [Colletotrichum scovillei]